MRYLGYVADPIASGTSFDDVVAGAIAVPTEFIPVSAAQVNPGNRVLDRNNEVRGRRANAAPKSFAAAPSMTFTARAYTKLCRDVVRKAMGGSIGSTGAGPAAITSTVQMLQSGNLPPIIPTLVREEQVDRLTGAVYSEIDFNYPAEEEGTVEVTLEALYHDVDAVGDVPGLPASPAGMPTYETAYMLRDVTAYLGDGAGVVIDCLAGFGWSLNNNLVDDFQSRFCAGRNIVDVTLDAKPYRLWYPERHKLGPQVVTGRLDFGVNRPDRELRRILAHTEKLVVELAGDPLATTPVVDEMQRLVFWKHAPTGGGPEPLSREGDQRSTYEFSAYLDDATGKDLEAVFVGSAALV